MVAEGVAYIPLVDLSEPLSRGICSNAVANRRHHGTRDNRTDTRNSHQSLAAVVLSRQRFGLGRHGLNALVQPARQSRPALEGRFPAEPILCATNIASSNFCGSLHSRTVVPEARREPKLR